MTKPYIIVEQIHFIFQLRDPRKVFGLTDHNNLLTLVQDRTRTKKNWKISGQHVVVGVPSGPKIPDSAYINKWNYVPPSERYLRIYGGVTAFEPEAFQVRDAQTVLDCKYGWSQQ